MERNRLKQAHRKVTDALEQASPPLKIWLASLAGIAVAVCSDILLDTIRGRQVSIVQNQQQIAHVLDLTRQAQGIAQQAKVDLERSQKDVEAALTQLDTKVEKLSSNQESVSQHTMQITYIVERLTRIELEGTRPQKWFEDQVKQLQSDIQRMRDQMQQIQHEHRSITPQRDYRQQGGDSWYWGQGNRPEPPESQPVLPSRQRVE
jgi:hypothetical protein